MRTLLVSLLISILLVLNISLANALPPSPGSEFVAMGDSYGSGWGADRTPSNLTIDNSVYAGNSCGRSSKAAQVLLATQWQLNLINAACGGANTSNLTTTGQKGEPPQLNRLTVNTKLATIIIGGNDASLLYILQMCVKPNSNCVASNTSGWWFSPASYISQMNKKIAALQAKIENVLRIAIQRSPQARIRIAGYPYLIAPPGQPTGTCSAWLNAGEQSMFADATARTNAAIRRGAEVIAAETNGDIQFVDPLKADSPFLSSLNGCSTNTLRYMNGPNDGAQGIWHPNIYGQKHYKQLYQQSLN